MVALSHRSIDESLKESAASVYAALDASQQAALEPVLRIHNDCQSQMFLAHLLRVGIAPSTADYLPGTVGYAEDAFQRVPLSELQFVIGGPRQSGKTTLLYLMSSVLCRRLQVSDDFSQYLLFPLNCELSALDFTDPQRLLRLFLRTTFEAIEYSSLRVLPYLDELRKWFTVSVFGSSIPPPRELRGWKGVDVEGLAALARDTKGRLQEDRDAKSQEDDSLHLFLKAVAAFPGDFARAVGLKGAIFIIDAFDHSSVVIEPGPGVFPRSLRAVCLSDVLSAELLRCPFIVSMKSEQLFFECFGVADAVLIGTDSIVPIAQNDEIEVRDAGIRIRVSDCGGHPGFVARFYHIAELAEAHRYRAAIPSPYAAVRAVSDISRLKTIAYELSTLLGLLEETGAEGIDPGAHRALPPPQALVVKFVSRKVVKKATSAELWANKREEIPQERVGTSSLRFVG
jgi:hypothetical protein